MGRYLDLAKSALEDIQRETVSANPSYEINELYEKRGVPDAGALPWPVWFLPVRDWLLGEPPEGIADNPFEWKEWLTCREAVQASSCVTFLRGGTEVRCAALFARWCPGTPDRAP